MDTLFKFIDNSADEEIKQLEAHKESISTDIIKEGENYLARQRHIEQLKLRQQQIEKQKAEEERLTRENAEKQAELK